MPVSAADVKALRDATGAGMMDCKKALEETGGDLDAAKDFLRQKGLASLDKRSARVTGEGLVEAFVGDDGRSAALVQVACETDFVAKGEQFGALAADIAGAVFDAATHEISGELEKRVGELVESAAINLGEKIQLDKAHFVKTESGVLDVYLHRTGGWAKKGVIVELDGDLDGEKLRELAHEVALHIQFARPSVLEADQVDPDELEHERQVAEAKARDEGKPEDIVPRIADGAVKKYVKQAALLEQPYVKDDKKSVRQWLEAESGGRARIVGFARFEIGEEAGA
ncbi:MAG: translation elongation factor Ts [Acidimicrobiia bacterium]